MVIVFGSQLSPPLPIPPLPHRRPQVDLTGFVVRVATQLTVRNDGKQEAASLLLCESQLGHLAFLEVWGGGVGAWGIGSGVAGGCRHAAAAAATVRRPAHTPPHPPLFPKAEQEGSDTPKLKWAPELVTPAGAPAGAACREFTLAAPLKKGGKAKLKAYGALTHVLRPEPAEVAQRDPQHVLYQDAAQLLSPYKVEAQTTEVGAACGGCVRGLRGGCARRRADGRGAVGAWCSLRLRGPAPTWCPARLSTPPPPQQLKVGSGSVESFTEVAPSKRSGRVITYGPYADATPWSAAPISGARRAARRFLRACRVLPRPGLNAACRPAWVLPTDCCLWRTPHPSHPSRSPL